MTRQGVRARGGETGVAQREAGGTRRARVSSDDCDKRGNEKKITAGEPEGTGPRERRGRQGANNGTKVHLVWRREMPCR